MVILNVTFIVRVTYGHLLGKVGYDNFNIQLLTCYCKKVISYTYYILFNFRNVKDANWG